MKIFQGIKITVQFWLKVFGEILRSLDITGAIMSSIPSIIAVLLVSVFSGIGLSKTDVIKTAWVEITGKQPDAWLTVSAAILVCVLIGLVYQPAKMYDELGGFAKRKMRVLFECKPRRYSEAWAGLRIYNDHPRLSITQCYTYFKEIINLSDGSNVLKRPGEKLTWTNSDPPIHGDKDIRPLGNRHPDILKTDNANNRIIFCTQGNPDLYSDKAGIGSYRIVIGVWGVFEGTAFDEEVEFILNYKGAWDIECKPIRELHVG